MKKIVILGSSIAGIRAVEKLKENGINSDVKLFHFNEHLPCYRMHIPSLISGDMTREHLFYREENYYQKNNIELIDKKIHRINLKRKLITTEDKEKYDFESLIIASTGLVKYPEIKGTNKSGVFCSQLFSHAEQILSCLPIIESVVVTGSSIHALKCANAINKKGKEVLLVVPESRILQNEVDKESSLKIHKYCEEAGITILLDQTISEILGEREVKAVRLSKGKVYSTEVVIFESVPSDMKIFKESGLHFNDNIPVGSQCTTNLENIFAVDEICSEYQNKNSVFYDTYDEYVEKQGERCASAIGDYEYAIEPVIPKSHLCMNDNSVVILGNTLEVDQCEGYQKSNDELNTYTKLFIKDNMFTGGVFINNSDNLDNYKNIIVGQNTLSELEENILEGYENSRILNESSHMAEPISEHEMLAPSTEERIVESSDN